MLLSQDSLEGKMNDSLDQFVVVLHRPRDAVNIGGVVRAMKNTGLTRLRLVDPVPFDHATITGIAHRSEDVLGRMELFGDLDASLADATYVVGTTARARGDHPLRRDLRAFAPELRQRAQLGTVALLFGSEDNGLDNAALDRCTSIMSLPVNPAYPSLNLAQAVLLVGYELWTAAPPDLPAAVPPAAAPPTPATAGEIETLFAETEQALHVIGFFKYSPTSAMRSLRQIAARAALDAREAAAAGGDCPRGTAVLRAFTLIYRSGNGAERGGTGDD